MKMVPEDMTTHIHPIPSCSYTSLVAQHARLQLTASASVVYIDLVSASLLLCRGAKAGASANGRMCAVARGCRSMG